jgi:two-component system sensor histidine kinase YesM
MDLRNKLLFFSLGYVLILMVLVYIFYTAKTTRNVYERNVESVSYEVLMENESLRTKIMLVEEMSNQIYYNIPLNKSLLDNYENIGASAEVYIDMINPLINDNLYTKKEIIDDISIYIRNESFIANEQEIKYATEDIIALDWYEAAMLDGNGGQIIWGYEKDAYGKSRLVLYRNLNGYLGRTSGVLRIAVNQSYVQTLMERDEVNLYAILQRRDDLNLAENAAESTEKELVDYCIKEIGRQGDGSFEFRQNDTDYMAIYKSFKSNNSQYTWKSLSVMPIDFFYNEVDQLRKNTVTLALITSLIEVLIIIFFANSFTRRIHTLDEKAQLVSQGNFDVRMEVGGLDEIGRLSVSMNKMLSYIDNLVNQVYEDKLKMQSYQLQQHESEFKVLQNQINPHFLYNTLDAMRYKATLAGNKELGDMMISLSRLLSYSINQKGNEVTLHQEIEHLKNYLALVKARFEDTVEYTIDIDKKFHKAIVNKLTLQPLVENCIVHGFGPKKKVLKIHVYAQNEGENLVISIKDNGKGISKQRLEEINSHQMTDKSAEDRTHVGIDNVNNRIKLLFGEGYGIKISSKEGVGTEVFITIPFKEPENEA